MRFTAKLKLGSKFPSSTSTTALTFGPNYGAHGAEVNKEWAEATPSLRLQMTVKNALAEQLELGDEFTVTFERDELESV